jgi:hypothetical protein
MESHCGSLKPAVDRPDKELELEKAVEISKPELSSGRQSLNTAPNLRHKA